jgi:hypothetical protein
MYTTQLTDYQLDNLTLLDILMNTLSAAEKIVFGPYEGKKYAFYDDSNSASWKTLPQLIKELQIQKECLHSMIKLYQKNSNKQAFVFPRNLSKQDIIEDLSKLRDAAYKKYKDIKINNIFNDIIKIINLNDCENYSMEQIFPKSNKVERPINEKIVLNQAKAIIETKERMIKRDKEHEQNIMNNNGNICYEAQLNLYKTTPKKDEKDYYKNFYYNDYL